MRRNNTIIITFLATCLFFMGAWTVLADGSVTQDTCRKLGGTVKLSGIYTDSLLKAEDAIDFTSKTTTSGDLNKTYCFSVTVTNLAEGCSITSINADFDGTGLPPANSHNISLSQSNDNTWSCILEGNTSGGYVSAFTITISHKCSYNEVITPSTCINHGNISDTCSCGHTVLKETLALANHQKETVNYRLPSYTEDGYTGDDYCSICGEKLREGTAIPKLEMGEIAGNFEGVFWKIRKDGVLQLGIDGVKQELISQGDKTKDMYPWNSHASNISAVEINGNIYAKGSIRGMFADLENVTGYTGLDKFDTSEVTNMRGMFYGNCSIESLDLSSFNTKNVTDMSGMFNNCTNMRSINLESFDTSKVTEMMNLFKDCKNLWEIDISSFDTTKVSSLSGLFYNCHSLKRIVLGRKFKATGQNTTSFPAYANGTSIQFHDARGREQAGVLYDSTETGYYAGTWNATIYLYFNSNGGEGSMSPKTYSYGGSSKLPAPLFTKPGSIFLGWANSEGKQLYSNKEEISYMSLLENGASSNRFTLYARWGTEDITELLKTATVEDVTYNGKPQVPKVEVEELVEGQDYYAEYSENINVGTGKVVLTGMKERYGSAELTFKIEPADISNGQISVDKTKYPCSANGSTIIVKKTLNSGEEPTLLEENVDYTIKYTDSEKESKGFIEVTGCGNYKGYLSLGVKLSDHDWDSGAVVREPNCTNKGEKEFACKICGNKRKETLQANGHSFSKWKTTKAATEVSTGSQSHKCSSCGKVETKVIPMLKPSLPAIKISKPKTAKKSAIIKWKKVSKKNQKKIGNIQIQYSLDKKFKKGVKTTTAKKTATAKRIKKLTSKKKYYVRIRAYKKAGGKIKVSKWSKVKAIKIK